MMNSAMFFAWSPIRSIAFAMNRKSRPTEIERGSSVMYEISLRTNARNSSSIALSSRTICAAATVSRRANASSARRRIVTAISPDSLISAMLIVRDAPSSIRRLVRFAIFSASSPARSRFVMVFEIAISRRRSRAAGWRRAMMLLHSSSISTSIVFRRASAVITCSARSRSKLLSASIALTICDSTRPPISSTFDETRFRSASNWLERCLSDMSCSLCSLRCAVSGLAEAAGDVVFRFLADRLDEDLFGVAEFDQFAKVHIGSVVRTARRLLHVVGDDHHGVVAFQLGDQFFDTAGRDGIERRARFIEEQHFRADRDPAGDAQTLLLAA